MKVPALVKIWKPVQGGNLTRSVAGMLTPLSEINDSVVAGHVAGCGNQIPAGVQSQ